MNEFARNLSNAMTPVYVKKFQLSHAPFAERYNGALYYEDDARKEILKKIAHLTDYTNLILFVQGAEGLGKTSLLKHRLQTGKANWRICFFNARDYVNTENFIEKLYSDFELKFQNTGDIHEARSLHEQIESLKQTGITPVLIIDDADHINPSILPTLQSLITFSGEQPPIVRLIIAGEDLPQRLKDILPQEKNAPAVKYLPIPPLSEKETSAYIKFRLTISGFKHVEPFNKYNLKRIYLDSKGFPKYINVLADHMLGQYAQSNNEKPNLLPISNEANKKLKITSGALGLLIVVVLLVGIFSPDEDLSNTAEQANVKQLEIPKFVATEIPRSELAKESPDSATKDPMLAKINAETKREPIVQKEEPDMSPPSPLPPTPSPAQKIIKVPAPGKPAASLLEVSNNWIGRQNPNHYTIQLISTSKKDAAESFIKKHKIDKDAYYFHFERKGRDWYSVIYGSFASAKTAKTETERLPSTLKKINPWIRPFKNIQSSMK